MISSRRVNRSVAISLIVVVTAATFARVITCEFVSWDDPETIAANPRINTPTIAGVVYYWRNPAGGLYIPVTYTYWASLAEVGMSPRLYHAGSVLLHVAAALLVYAIARQLTASDGASCIGALLFALHPVQVESVAWASGAKDLLAGVFALATVDQFLRHAAKRQAGVIDAVGDGKFHYGAALLCFAVAILAKPSVVVAPVIAVIVVRFRFDVPLRSLVIRAAPMLLLAAACVAWSRAAQDRFAQSDTPLWTRPLIAADAVTFYLGKLAWPADLRIIYGRTPRAVLDSGAAHYAWVVPVVVLTLALLVRRRTPWVLAGLMVFIVALLPVLGFMRFMFQIHSTVADHYLYLPMLGAAIAVAGLVALRPSARVLATCGVLLALLAVASFQQIAHWRDSERLFARVLEYHPDSAFARGGLGRAYAEEGRYDDAAREFGAAVELSPTSRMARAQLAQALLLSGRYDAAVAEAGEALRVARPGDDTSWERHILERALHASTKPTTRP